LVAALDLILESKLLVGRVMTGGYKEIQADVGSGRIEFPMVFETASLLTSEECLLDGL